VVLEPAADRPRGRSGGLAVIDIAACTVAEAASLMTWSITDTGFRMTLDRQVPDVLAKHVGPAIDDLLARNQLRLADVQAWAVHPGGPRILDVVADRLGLPEADLAGSRRSWLSTATAPRPPCCLCSKNSAAARCHRARRWSRWRSAPA